MKILTQLAIVFGICLVGGMYFGNTAVYIPFQRNWNDYIIFADAG